jgi:hypothetical protein
MKCLADQKLKTRKKPLPGLFRLPFLSPPSLHSLVVLSLVFGCRVLPCIASHATAMFDRLPTNITFSSRKSNVSFLGCQPAQMGRLTSQATNIAFS